MKKSLKNKILILGVFVCLFAFFMQAHADPLTVIGYESEDCVLDIIDNGEDGHGGRELMVNINNVAPGRRITGFQYCSQTADCTDATNWTDLTGVYASNFINAVGNNDITIAVNVPDMAMYLRGVFADLEPMDITYANYKLRTEDHNEFRRVYADGTHDLDNYETTFKNLVTGYRGGDIILPADCSENGCVLKFTLTTADYNSMVERVNYFNEHENRDVDAIPFIALAEMNNHLESADSDSVLLYSVDNQTIFDVDGKKVFYLIINKFFSENNRSNFTIADNEARILSEDYIGLKVKVDRKYFDEADGFLSFNEFNHYRRGTTLFYGTPKVQFSVDRIIPVALAAGGDASGMGTVKNTYTTIVSRDQSKYPINDSFELTINSFYEPEYIVPLTFKDASGKKVKDVDLELSRFAFGGNAGNLLLVDGDGINCKQPWNNPDCREGNIYVSTSYRGLIDTFYADGTSATVNTFQLSLQRNGVTGDFRDNITVYRRNQDFNPWAVAIFYHDDEVVATRSFNLGELVKTEGMTRDVIANSDVNGKVKRFDGTMIDDYNSADYEYFAYGLGYEKPIKDIVYFSEQEYQAGSIDYPVILASKEELIDNDINRIALFLTNGELKSDEDNFPELTYGVGEGKIFEVDGRTFEELGGAH